MGGNKTGPAGGVAGEVCWRPGVVVVMLLLVLLPWLLAGCAVPGKMAGKEPFRVDRVTVRIEPTLGASQAFADRLRGAVLEASAFWNTTGSAKRVALMVRRYHIQRAGRVLVHGDGSLAEARAVVIDAATGRVDATVMVRGVVPHAIGATGNGRSVNRDVEESGIAAALAMDLMVKLRGPAAIEVLQRRAATARARVPDTVDGPSSWRPRLADIAARRTAGVIKTPTSFGTNHGVESRPAAWDRGGEMRCLALLDRALSGDASVVALAPHCRVLGYRLPGGRAPR